MLMINSPDADRLQNWTTVRLNGMMLCFTEPTYLSPPGWLIVNDIFNNTTFGFGTSKALVRQSMEGGRSPVAVTGDESSLRSFRPSIWWLAFLDSVYLGIRCALPSAWPLRCLYIASPRFAGPIRRLSMSGSPFPWHRRRIPTSVFRTDSSAPLTCVKSKLWKPIPGDSKFKQACSFKIFRPLGWPLDNSEIFFFFFVFFFFWQWGDTWTRRLPSFPMPVIFRAG